MKNEQSELTTHQLMEFLQNTDGLEKFLVQNKEHLQPQGFPQYLLLLLEERHMTVPQLVLVTNLSKPFVYQLFSGVRTAGRNVVLRLAFALSLSVEEAQRLLTLSGNSVLYPKLRRDAAIIFCLNKKLPIAETDELLLGLPEKQICTGGE